MNPMPFITRCAKCGGEIIDSNESIPVAYTAKLEYNGKENV